MSASSSSTLLPRLLRLPAEIRNVVYKYALLEDDEIELSQHQCSEPALLHTCRQIRDEAGPIFYQQNRFFILLQDCKFEPQPAHWVWSRAHHRTLENSGQYKWVNIKERLRRFHEGTRPGCNFQDDADEFSVVFKNAFSIVKKLEALEWVIVDGVLDAFKESVNVKTYSWKLE